uniref:Uncharacterized protein n=1 Tax=Aureoumbra lagunensis TaxID=44058 RepID=A0A7S3JV23_9STRA
MADVTIPLSKKIGIDVGTLSHGRIRNVRIVAVPEKGLIRIKPYVFLFNPTALPQRQFGFYGVSKNFRELFAAPRSDEDEISFVKRRHDWLVHWAEVKLGRRHNEASWSKRRKARLERRATAPPRLILPSNSHDLKESYEHQKDENENSPNRHSFQIIQADYDDVSDAETDVISLDGDISEEDIIRARISGQDISYKNSKTENSSIHIKASTMELSQPLHSSTPIKDEDNTSLESDGTDIHPVYVDDRDRNRNMNKEESFENMLLNDSIHATTKPSQIAISLYNSRAKTVAKTRQSNSRTGVNGYFSYLDGDCFVIDNDDCCCNCGPTLAVTCCTGREPPSHAS